MIEKTKLYHYLLLYNPDPFGNNSPGELFGGGLNCTLIDIVQRFVHTLAHERRQLFLRPREPQGRD